MQQKSAGVGNYGLSIGQQDPGVHLSGRLLQLLIMISRVVAVSGLLHYWFVVRGVVNIFSLWGDMFSLLMLRIRMDSGFANPYLKELPFQVMSLISNFFLTSTSSDVSRRGVYNMHTLNRKF